MYIGVLWPKVCEFDGIVFLPELATVDISPDEIGNLLGSCGYDKVEVEKRVNRVEVAQLFGRNDAPDEMDLALAERLAAIWPARLNAGFPDRSFVVEVDVAVDAIYVVAYQDRGMLGR